MARLGWLPLLGLALLAATDRSEAAGDSVVGAEVFRTCAACHTLEPGVHRTGPSLAGLFGRKAGTAVGFHRYSDALKAADLAWREDTLDGFLADPQGFLPGNRMTFRGIDDAQTRADLIAYLRAAKAVGGRPPESAGQGGMMGNGMAGSSDMPDLKTLGPEQQVTAMRQLLCHDRRRADPRVLGVQPPLQDRFERERSAPGPCCPAARRHDGRQGICDLRSARGDQCPDREALLMTNR
jgi:cytochrome c2